MALALLAFVPAGVPQIVKFDGVYNRTDDYRPTPIGFLSEFIIDDAIGPKEFDKASKMLRPFGLKPEYVCIGIPGNPGRMGVSVSIGVFFDNVEEAMKVPGFIVFGSFAGVYDLDAEKQGRHGPR